MIKAAARLVEIGDTQGIVLPDAVVAKYGFREEVVLEELENGVLIHSKAPSAQAPSRLSWEETYRQMAAEDEDWSDWQDLHDEDRL